MFIGHFALGYAARRAAPAAPFALLFSAPQVADLVWPILVVLGVEHAGIEPGATAMNPLDLSYMPYSHSLAALIGWGALLGLIAWRIADARSGVVVAALVVSHWPLDWITHRPDMQLIPGGARYGLGLWNSMPATMITEFLMYGAGIWLYFRSTRARDRTGSYGAWALVAVTIALYVASAFASPPPNIQAVVVPGIFGAALFIACAWWSDRHRTVVA